MIHNFVYNTPTKVFFGRGVEENVGETLKNAGATKILLHFGGGSVKKSGLYDKIVASLEAAGLDYVAFGGVAPNPKLSLIREGIALCKAEKVDFLLAVGGGSVIDSTKAIGIGLATGRDPWDFVEKGETPQVCMPLAVVLTLSAAGSEMSNSDVITNEETNLKRGITAECVRPKFAFLNPENTFTVSKFQTGCGIVDTMMHTLERYFTGENFDLSERLAEGLLNSVKQAGAVAIEHPDDYDARATLMWASSLSHNDLTGCGKIRKFPVHKIEHDISGLHDNVAHGAGLAVLFPAWARYMIEHDQDVAQFAKLAVRLWDVQPSDNAKDTALAGVAAMKQYFQSLGMPTTMQELGLTPADYDAIIAKTTANGNKVKSYFDLGAAELLEIYQLAE